MNIQHNASLAGFSVEGKKLLRDGNVIFESPTAICEIARVDESLFVIVHPEDKKRQSDYAGTNLWALDLNGNVLWKAQNLNADTAASKRTDVHFYARLRVYDALAPKLICYVDDRYSPSIDAATGAPVDIYTGINWSNYSEAWPKAQRIQKEIEGSTFVNAERLWALKGQYVEPRNARYVFR
ncbi:hypothetical protein [Hyphomicrobium sp.]|jgi:hypothetical protein|uniref:hypothetical protein n=1 Tax=Hyphomicrobium sp. TaxID=82 RepID=UPI00356A5C6D